MARRIATAMLTAGLALLLAEAPAAAQGGGWTTPRTPWGHPDVQGIWSNTTTTPMERPEDLAGREFLTEEERVARNPGSGISAETRTEFMPTGAVNDYWLEKGELLLRTSLIVDPPDGRYPPLTPEAQARLARRRASYTGGELASWEDFSTYDRCLTRGMPGAMTPGVVQPQLPDPPDADPRRDSRRDDPRRPHRAPRRQPGGRGGAVDGTVNGPLGRRHPRHRDDAPRGAAAPRGRAADAHRRRLHRLRGDRQ